VASYAEMLTPAGLRAIAGYAQGLGPEKSLVIGVDGTATALVGDAHAVGLVVHPWTMRAENAFLPPDLRSGDDPAAAGLLNDEIARHLEAGVDGFFTDFPYAGVAARDRFARRRGDE
jgi:glycerophosphoryl diester phosphodiesterase